MTKQELVKLRDEILKLEDDLYKKRIKLEENCPHNDIQRGIDSVYYSDSICDEERNTYTYKCLFCKQKWEFDRPYPEFEKKLKNK